MKNGVEAMVYLVVLLSAGLLPAGRRGSGNGTFSISRARSGVPLVVVVLLLCSFQAVDGASRCAIRDSTMPCTYGGCTFSKDGSGILDKTGSCASETGDLRLDNKGIKGLRDGVFDNMGGCT